MTETQKKHLTTGIRIFKMWHIWFISIIVPAITYWKSGNLWDWILFPVLMLMFFCTAVTMAYKTQWAREQRAREDAELLLAYEQQKAANSGTVNNGPGTS